MTENATTATPVELLVMRLVKQATAWEDKAIAVEREWYNDAAAYNECAEDLTDLAKELMPQFECCWCRDHAGLEPNEYTFEFANLGGWCVDTSRPICKACKWNADDAA